MDVSFVYEHYEKDDWPLRMENNLNENNQVRQPLVEKEKVLLPPLLITFGLVKNFE